MDLRKAVATGVVTLALLGSTLGAQAPVQNVEPAKHPNLAAAQGFIAQAYQKVLDAQKANKDELNDHAEKAKALLSQANHEIQLAAEASNAHGR